MRRLIVSGKSWGRVNCNKKLLLYERNLILILKTKKFKIKKENFFILKSEIR